MFICPEIEKVPMTARQLFELYVCEKRIDTNAAQIEGISADGSSGTWTLLKKGWDLIPQMRGSGTAPRWYVKDDSLKTFGTFPYLTPAAGKSIAAFSAHTGIPIGTNFTNSDTLHWAAANAFELRSDFWFTVYTADGLTLAVPQATGLDRGLVLERDVLIRQDFCKTVNYSGEAEGDVLVAATGNVQPQQITSAYKDMAVNKFVALQNYIVFAAHEVYFACDTVRSWDGRKYVILSGRKQDKDTYVYTAILESLSTGSYSAADANSVLLLPGEIDKWHYVGATGEPAFQNSWVLYGNSSFYPVRFKKNPSGRVFVEGAVKNGTGTGNVTVFTLPAGYRPAVALLWQTSAYDGTNTNASYIYVQTSGAIQVKIAAGTAWQLINFSFDTLA